MRNFSIILLVICLGTTAMAASKVNWNSVVSQNKSPKNLEERLLLGVAYANLGKIEESASQFEILGKANYDQFAREVIRSAEGKLAKNSSDLVALNCLAFAYYARDDFRRARDNFQKLVNLDSGNVWSHNYLAIVYGKLGQVDSGIAQLKKSLEIEPKNEYTHLLMGLAYTEKGQYGNAAKHYIKAPRALKTIIKLSR